LNFPLELEARSENAGQLMAEFKKLQTDRQA
jgi:hypothetical protein